MSREPVSPEMLRQLLRYEPETGKLFWLPRTREMFSDDRSFNTWTTRFSGKEALTALANTGGYKHGHILSHKVIAHRAIWAMVHGEWPDDEIDHINGSPRDNRLVNLRRASRLDQCRNLSRSKNNKSGVVGVHWCARKRKWTAQISIHNRSVLLGRFRSFEDAVAARREAQELHGFHPNHGRQAAK